jgi:very-short-patch-repair endonuclease
MPSVETKHARYLRQNMTVTERRLWLKLRGRQLDGWKFRRQHPIGEYVVDFYCPAARLVIELDGASHDREDRFDYGQRRQAWLESQCYKVLRFSADDPAQDYLDGVWDTIDLELTKIARAGLPSGASRHLPASGED